MLTTLTNLHGQTYPLLKVDSVETPFPGRDYYRYGYDRFSAAPPAAPAPNELIDSVTVGAIMKYFVSPCVDANPDWYTDRSVIKDITDTVLLKTAHQWRTTHSSQNVGIFYHPVLSVVSTKQKTPFFSVAWNRLSDAKPDTLSVMEYITRSDGSISRADTVPVAVRVINRPSATFTDTATVNKYSGVICGDINPLEPKEMKDTVFRYFPVQINSEVAGYKRLRIAYQVLDASGAVVIPLDTVRIPENGSDSILLKIIAFGEYHIHLTGVFDRISQKCRVAGNPVLSSASAGHSDLFKVIVTPLIQQFNPLYRIPNDRLSSVKPIRKQLQYPVTP
jgi:hypothetical protein